MRVRLIDFQEDRLIRELASVDNVPRRDAVVLYNGFRWRVMRVDFVLVEQGSAGTLEADVYIAKHTEDVSWRERD